MKNQGIRSITVMAIAMVMIIGVNAQNSGGKGMGPGGQSGQGSQAYGQGGQGYGPCGQAYGPGNGQHMQNFLNLSDEQKEELKILRVKHYKEMKPIRAEMGELQARQLTLMSQEEVDVKSVNILIDQKTSLMNVMQKKKVNHQLAFREILTDEQIMMLDQKRMLAGKRKAGRGQKMNHSGRGRGMGV